MTNNILSKREMLEYRKGKLEDYLKDIKKHHVSGKTWDIWEDIVNTSILIEEINKEISEEIVAGLKDSLKVYANEIKTAKDKISSK